MSWGACTILGGSGGMLPRKNFWFLGAQKSILRTFE